MVWRAEKYILKCCPLWGRQDPGGPYVGPINIVIWVVKTFNSEVNLFVCFITKSFLTYSFVLPTPTLSTICRPLSSYVCSITPETANVGSSYSHMRGPDVGCWFSYRSNCRHWSFEAALLPINPNIYTDQCDLFVIYHSITFTGRYTTMQPTLLTSWLRLMHLLTRACKKSCH